MDEMEENQNDNIVVSDTILPATESLVQPHDISSEDNNYDASKQ